MARRPKDAGELKRDEFLDAIGHRIKVARVQAGLSPKQLATLLATNPSWIYMAEDGQQNFQVSSLRKIAEALSISVRDLIPPPSDSGSEFDVSVETRETFQKLISQLTEAIGELHRLNALADRRKNAIPSEARPKPKNDTH